MAASRHTRAADTTSPTSLVAVDGFVPQCQRLVEMSEASLRSRHQIEQARAGLAIVVLHHREHETEVMYRFLECGGLERPLACHRQESTRPLRIGKRSGLTEVIGDGRRRLGQ